MILSFVPWRPVSGSVCKDDKPRLLLIAPLKFPTSKGFPKSLYLHIHSPSAPYDNHNNCQQASHKHLRTAPSPFNILFIQ